jgi:hypothetical protein
MRGAAFDHRQLSHAKAQRTAKGRTRGLQAEAGAEKRCRVGDERGAVDLQAGRADGRIAFQVPLTGAAFTTPRTLPLALVPNLLITGAGRCLSLHLGSSEEYLPRARARLPNPRLGGRREDLADRAGLAGPSWRPLDQVARWEG